MTYLLRTLSVIALQLLPVARSAAQGRPPNVVVIVAERHTNPRALQRHPVAAAVRNLAIPTRQ